MIARGVISALDIIDTDTDPMTGNLGNSIRNTIKDRMRDAIVMARLIDIYTVAIATRNTNNNRELVISFICSTFTKMAFLVLRDLLLGDPTTYCGLICWWVLLIISNLYIKQS